MRKPSPRAEGERFDRHAAGGEFSGLKGWKPIADELGFHPTQALRLVPVRLAPAEVEAARRVARRRGIALDALVSAWVREGIERASRPR